MDYYQEGLAVINTKTLVGTELRSQGRCDERPEDQETMKPAVLQCEMFTKEIQFVGEGYRVVSVEAPTQRTTALMGFNFIDY